MAFPFLFATGIENSNPTVGSDNRRVDELAKCGHYQHWRRDFELVTEMRQQFLRYGPPIHPTWLGSGKYDRSFADETFADLRRRIAHRGFVPLRGARLAGQLSQPRLPGPVYRLRPRLRPALSLGAVLHPGE